MKLMKFIGLMAFTLTLILSNSVIIAGVVDPDCNVEKATKSVAMKATVGVGGRCKPVEAATDMGKNALGIEDKGPIEKKRKKDDGLAKKALD